MRTSFGVNWNFAQTLFAFFGRGVEGLFFSGFGNKKVHGFNYQEKD
jgi:hypothetical protein